MERIEGKSRSYHSIKNIISGYAYQFVMILLTFVSRTIFIRVLGVEYLGLNSIFSDILNMLSLADLGISSAMTYSFYKPIAENDTEKISALVGFYKKLYTLIAAIISIIGLCLTPFLKYILNLEQPIDNLNTYYILSLASVVSSYLFIYKTAIIIADQKNYIINKINIVAAFIKTMAQIILLIVFENYTMYLLVGVVGTFLINYISSYKAEVLYPYIRKKVTLEKSEKKSIYETLKSVFIYKLSSVLLNATDNTIISILLGTVTVGYYSNYFMLSSKIIQIVALIFTSLTASIGNIIVKEKSQKRYQIFSIEQSISFIVSGIVVSCFIVLVNDLIYVWLGKTFVLDLKVVVVVSLNMYLSIVLQPLWSYREATGLYVKTKWIMLYAAIINIVLSIILGKIIGLVGILLASVIARSVTYVWYEPIVLFKEYFNVSVRKYFRNLICNVIITGIVTIVLSTIFQQILVKSWLGLIFKGVVCGMISTVIFGISYYKTDGIKLLYARMKKTENSV